MLRPHGESIIICTSVYTKLTYILLFTSLCTCQENGCRKLPVAIFYNHFTVAYH